MNEQIDASFSLQSLANVSTYRAGITQSTAHRLLKRFTDACLAPYDLTTMHWFILGVISEAEDGMTITDLSKAVDTNVPYITNAINSLETKGMVVRNQRAGKDGRTRVITIHPDFRPMVHQIEQDLRDNLRTVLYSNVTNAELRTYIAVLTKFTASLQKYQ